MRPGHLVAEAALVQALAEDRAAAPGAARAVGPCLLGGRPAGAPAPAPPGAPAPGAARAWVQKQGLAPLAFTHGLTQFRPDYALASIRAEQQRGFAREATAALRAEGIAVLLLKGISYAGGLYTDPAERPMSDVDLLVEDRDHARATARLEALGYQHAGPAAQRSPRHHAITLKRPQRANASGVHGIDRGAVDAAAVDLHRSPAQRGRIALPLADLWRRAIPAPWIEGAVRPEALDELLLHLANLARHDLIVPAIAFVDAGRMWRRLAPVDRAELARRADTWRFARVADACIEAVEVACGWRARRRRWLPGRDELLSGHLPPRAHQIGRKLLLIEGPRELAAYAGAVLDGWRQGLSTRNRG